MKLKIFVFLFFAGFLAGKGFGQSEPRFYLYEYFLLHDAQGKVIYDISHEDVRDKIFEEMGIEAPDDSPEKIEIPAKISSKEIYPVVGEKIYAVIPKVKKRLEAEVTNVYLQYDSTMRRYVPAFTYEDLSYGETSGKTGSLRDAKSVPSNLFISVPTGTSPRELPHKIKLETALKKKILEQIRLKYKDVDLENEKVNCQFIGAMSKKYVVVTAEPNLSLSVEVYEVRENGTLRKICGEHFSLFT